MTHYRLCGFTSNNGKDCMKEVPKDFPINLCIKHLIRAGEFYEDVKLFLYADGKKPVPGRKVTAFDRVDKPEATYTPEAQDQSLVYYIRFQNLIKIGFSTNIYNRLAALPWEQVLALEPGSTNLETSRHRKFKDHLAAKREWFHDVQEIRDHIAKVRGRFPHLSRLADRITAGEASAFRSAPMEDPVIPHSIRTRLKGGGVVDDAENFREEIIEPAGNLIAGAKFQY